MDYTAMLIQMIDSYAPEDVEYYDFEIIVDNAKKDGAAEKDIYKILIGILHDGLQYGNWPWNKYTIN